MTQRGAVRDPTRQRRTECGADTDRETHEAERDIEMSRAPGDVAGDERNDREVEFTKGSMGTGNMRLLSLRTKSSSNRRHFMLASGTG